MIRQISLKIFSVMLLLLMFPLGGQAAVKGAPPKTGGDGKVIQSKGQVNAPKGTPTWEIQEIERKLEEYQTGPGVSAQQKAENRRIKREILNGAFDLRELSRLALDKHWRNISASQRSGFVNLMTSLLETKAIFSKEQSKTKGKTYTVSYKGDQYYDKKKHAKTLTQIYVPKDNVTLDIEYKLKRSGNEWKVFDIVVDDASLVENYRYQFSSIISKHSYSELVRRMRKKLNELRSNK